MLNTRKKYFLIFLSLLLTASIIIAPSEQNYLNVITQNMILKIDTGSGWELIEVHL